LSLSPQGNLFGGRAIGAIQPIANGHTARLLAANWSWPLHNQRARCQLAATRPVCQLAALLQRPLVCLPVACGPFPVACQAGRWACQQRLSAGVRLRRMIKVYDSGERLGRAWLWCASLQCSTRCALYSLESTYRESCSRTDHQSYTCMTAGTKRPSLAHAQQAPVWPPFEPASERPGQLASRRCWPLVCRAPELVCRLSRVARRPSWLAYRDPFFPRRNARVQRFPPPPTSGRASHAPQAAAAHTQQGSRGRQLGQVARLALPSRLPEAGRRQKCSNAELHRCRNAEIAFIDPPPRQTTHRNGITIRMISLLASI